MIPKGTIIEGPGAQSYEVVSDLFPWGPMPSAEDFIAHGGAPAPVIGMMMPHWLEIYLWQHKNDKVDARG